ncbi:MAG: hypothetical protein M0Z94_19170 [Dehalococcoidales bacterium]|nr:hypothetical protein [Dehalococcoidales bacterium]
MNSFTRWRLDISRKVALIRPVERGMVTAPPQVDDDNCTVNGMPLS